MGDTRTVVALSDTSLKVSQVYFERLRAMTPAERVRLGVGLWQAGHALQLAAARRGHPDAGDLEIAFEVAVTRFGEKLARAAYKRV